MTTLLVTHPCFVEHDTGYGHPERADRMRAIDKVLAHEAFAGLVRKEASLRDDVETQIGLVHAKQHLERVRAAASAKSHMPLHLDPDTVLSAGTWEAALRAVGAGLDAVDEGMTGTAPSASPWSTSTCTTATAPRTSSGPTRTCSTARRTRCRCSRAPAQWARPVSATSGMRRSPPATAARPSAKPFSPASCRPWTTSGPISW